MARSLGVDEFEFDRLYVWRKYGRPSLREASNYDCVFLGGNRDRCMVYESRPAQCGSFPFWPEILKNRQSWDEYSQTCPGMNEGDLHNEEEIARLLSSVL
jgi:Fe-S-cluster containining protein